MDVIAQPGYLQQGDLSLSIVVPVLNEISTLASLTAALAQTEADQVVIVDGGSNDGTLEWLQQEWLEKDTGRLNDTEGLKRRLLESTAGRARQMNRGAAEAVGDVILFLHADTVLPKGARDEVLTARRAQRLWGRFDVGFSSNQTAMGVIAFFINWRSRLSGIATGDQAIFVDAELFRLIDGYEEIPLMEDIAISKRLKQYCQPYCSRRRVITSARRWQENGVVKTVLLMWVYRLAYFFGVSADRLAKSYRAVR